DKCEQPYQLNQTDMEECTEIETFDYFSGSEASFILTFFASGLFAIGCILLLFFLGRKKDAAMKTIRAGDRKKHANKMDSDERIFITNEWRGKERERAIKVKLGPGRQMSVLSDFGRVLRMVEFTDAVKTIDMQVAPDKGRKMMLIRVEKEYDL
ncbi:dual oxidase-like, partial [Saccoglossus kowalevskii]